jgi:hypothetical protein
VALAIAQTLAFQTSPYTGTNPLVSASVSLPANSLVIVTTGSVSYLDTYHTANTPTNTGTALTWALVNTNENDDGSGYVQSQIWYAKNTTAQTITISVYYDPTGGFDVQRSLCGYVITGHDLTTPIGTTNIGSLSLSVASSDALALLSITDTSTTALTSSNMVETTVSTASGTAILAYQPVASPGTFTASVSRGLSLPASVMGEIKVASSGTAHTAAGTATATATGTAAMSNARTLQGTGTGTATGTAIASNQRTLAASASVTASGTSAMSSTQAMSVSGSVTATGTGAASRGQSVTGSASVTASGTAAMSSTKVIGASGTGTATGVAEVLLTRSMSASGTVTATGISEALASKEVSASATVTATGTAAASNQLTLAGTATATASATASMSSTQVIGGSGTGTGTGTANSSTAGVGDLGGTGTGTATGTGGIEKVTNLYRCGNVYRNAGTYPGGAALVGCNPNIIVAAGSAAMTKTRHLEATATATATSDAGMTHTFYIFKPPTREISPLSLDPYYQLVGYLQGRTLVKRDGVWKLVQNRQEDWLDQCEYVFKGGCENRINGTEKAELESAGYTVETRTS